MSFITTSFESFTGLPDPVGYLFSCSYSAPLSAAFFECGDHRVPNEESIVFRLCMSKCKAQLKAYDNIPILSWSTLGGNAEIAKRIAIRYPAVELLTALSWILVYWRFGFDPMLFVGLVFVSTIIALMFIDAEHMILPNVITYPFCVFAFLVRIIYPIAFGTVFSDMTYRPLASMTAYPAWAVSLVGAF
jgi:prepilin signal peptidase PulO-like enzyme (type II secretory pathway)